MEKRIKKLTAIDSAEKFMDAYNRNANLYHSYPMTLDVAEAATRSYLKHNSLYKLYEADGQILVRREDAGPEGDARMTPEKFVKYERKELEGNPWSPGAESDLAKIKGFQDRNNEIIDSPDKLNEAFGKVSQGKSRMPFIVAQAVLKTYSEGRLAEKDGRIEFESFVFPSRHPLTPEEMVENTRKNLEKLNQKDGLSEIQKDELKAINDFTHSPEKKLPTRNTSRNLRRAAALGVMLTLGTSAFAEGDGTLFGKTENTFSMKAVDDMCEIVTYAREASADGRITPDEQSRLDAMRANFDISYGEGAGKFVMAKTLEFAGTPGGEGIKRQMGKGEISAEQGLKALVSKGVKQGAEKQKSMKTMGMKLSDYEYER